MKNALLILIITLSTFSACKKKDADSSSPATYVDTYINISNPMYSNLNAVGGWCYIDAGVRGIIVYRSSITEFMAYERNCTYQSGNACAQVEVEASGFIAVDSCCGSKFMMSDGSVNAAPATLPLTRYQTSFDGATTLHIFN